MLNALKQSRWPRFSININIQKYCKIYFFTAVRFFISQILHIFLQQNMFFFLNYAVTFKGFIKKKKKVEIWTALEYPKSETSVKQRLASLYNSPFLGEEAWEARTAAALVTGAQNCYHSNDGWIPAGTGFAFWQQVGVTMCVTPSSFVLMFQIIVHIVTEVVGC